MTNREWLIELNDKEFAKYLFNIKLINCENCVFESIKQKKEISEENRTTKIIEKWLREEHKDGTD